MGGYDSRQYEQNVLGLLQNQGNIAAQGALASSQAWSGAAQQIGNIAAQTFQQLQEQRVQKKREEAFNVAMDQWDSNDPENSVMRLARVVGPEEAMKFGQGLQSFQSMRIKNAQAELPTMQELKDGIVGAHILMKNSPGAFAEHYPMMRQEFGPVLKERFGYDMPEQPTPEVEQGLNALAEEWGKPAEGKAFTLKAGETQYDATGKVIASQPAIPKEEKQYQVTVPGPNGPVTKLVGEAEMKGGVREYQKPPSGGMSGMGGMGGGQRVDLTPDAIENAAAVYRVANSMPTRFDENDKKRIMNKAAEQNKILGRTPAGMIQHQAAFKADTGALTQMRKMASSAEAFENKAIAQTDIIADLSKKVSRSDWPIINEGLLKGKLATGDSNTTQLYNAISTFAAEYAKIMEGSTGSAAASSDSARKAAERLINAAMNKGTTADVLALMKKEMHLTRQGYDATIGHITERMGGVVSPESAGAPPSGGPTAVNPKTGERIQWNGTAWVPIK